MTNTEYVVDGMPTARSCPFSPPDELTALRAEQPIVRMAYPDGREGWLVTGYDLAQEVLANPAFSARHDLRSSPIPMGGKLGPAQPGIFIGMDPPDHTRYRKPLSRHFTVRRVRDLEPAIERITDACLDALEAQGSPADFMATFALPLPVLVICELMGASADLAAELQKLRVPMLSPGAAPADVAHAAKRTSELMHDLVRERRAAPGGDLLSELIATGELNDEELANLTFLMLIAGHETTANTIAMSVYLLLQDDAVRASLGDGSQVDDRAVNELLRYLSVVQFVSRAALADVELGGRTVRQGETVTISTSAVNRDERRFAEPDAFHAEGAGVGNLAFGHGLHQCIGHNLARTEIRIALGRLLGRFPGLRLAARPQDIATRDAMNTYGVTELPVRW
ncbi:cytochrome P450 [Streptomyces sp. NPDC020917]|uniref:cytochrome P450 n=1 Tax=Streptomyces sp. NPDC020917 TaxID=3365102 RepID=UPI00379349B1